MAYGTTRLRGRIDHLLGAYVPSGLDAVDATVRELLRLGAYQILYMDGVPDYAAVSATVQQAKAAAGQRRAGFVNAVLRRLASERDGPERFPSYQADPATFLSSWGSHPRWLVDRWLERWSADEVRALVETNNRRPGLFVVPLDVSPEEAAGMLVSGGIDADPVGDGTRCVRLADGSSPTAALSALPVSIVQDPAANLVVLYSDVPRGTIVADLCAAPGGKALAASDRPQFTFASDRSESRIQMVRDNARRTGRRVGLAVADARHPPLAEVDVVLLDAPCSGTGTLARHPDARWRLRPESINQMADLQAGMLRAAARIVVPGGLLVYSTCALEIEENEARVAALLDERDDFSLEPTDAVPSRHLDGSGCLFVAPWRGDHDGAFAARLRRAA